MIPKGFGTDLAILEDIQTSSTYKLMNKKIQGDTDNLEALQQAIYKMLNTEKYEYPIYSLSYGIYIENLIGKDSAYVKIELKRRIQECLLKDNRIKSVDNFVFTMDGDKLFCTFDVASIYGSLAIERQVTI